MALTSFSCFDNFDGQGDFHKEVMIVSNLLGIIIGVVVVIIGLILLVAWWGIFIRALMAVVPILLVLIGAGVLIYFISEFKSKAGMAKTEGPAAGDKKSE